MQHTCLYKFLSELLTGKVSLFQGAALHIIIHDVRECHKRGICLGDGCTQAITGKTIVLVHCPVPPLQEMLNHFLQQQRSPTNAFRQHRKVCTIPIFSNGTQNHIVALCRNHKAVQSIAHLCRPCGIHFHALGQHKLICVILQERRVRPQVHSLLIHRHKEPQQFKLCGDFLARQDRILITARKVDDNRRPV